MVVVLAFIFLILFARDLIVELECARGRVDFLVLASLRDDDCWYCSYNGNVQQCT